MSRAPEPVMCPDTPLGSMTPHAGNPQPLISIIYRRVFPERTLRVSL